jgi:hypothetical protein
MVSPHTCRVVQLVRAYVNVEVSNQLFEYVSLVSTRGLKNKEKDLVTDYVNALIQYDSPCVWFRAAAPTNGDGQRQRRAFLAYLTTLSKAYKCSNAYHQILPYPNLVQASCAVFRSTQICCEHRLAGERSMSNAAIGE